MEDFKKKTQYLVQFAKNKHAKRSGFSNTYNIAYSFTTNLNRIKNNFL